MVERSSLLLDAIFASLADPTRRDILRRVSRKEHSVKELTKRYSMSFAAVSKHLKVLEKANLVTKKRRGKEQRVSLAPQAIVKASEYLETYKKLWENRLDSLETYLSTFPQ